MEMVRKKRSRLRKRLDKMWDGIRYTYWGVIPYDWRPMQILYRLKCWGWRRHTTIKSRYLPHTWVDRVEVLPQTMFEILSRFIEQECSPGHIEWYGEYGHKIKVKGVEKYVRDEMQDLYDWWHQVYNKQYEEVNDMLWAEAQKHRPDPDKEFLPIDIDGNPVDEDEAEYFKWEQNFPTVEDEEVYHRCMKGMNKLEEMQNRKLDEMLHRLIRIRRYMWT